MKEQDKSGPQWDPEKVPECMREGSEDENAAALAHATAYAEASARVMRRVKKARDLECRPLFTPDAYHVTGGTDNDGHTVDLRAEWGHVCTCGSHIWDHAFCKHMMRVGLERGESFSDTATVASGGQRVPGLFSRAMRVEMEKPSRGNTHTEDEKS
jgi:hypothetical protein